MSASGHALVLADGALGSVADLDATWPGWSDGIDLVVAADGGARHAATVARRIDLWVGDGDSIDPAELARLEAAGVPVRRSRPDKDETDTELAILAAVEADARRLTILGALGGARLDHALANVWLLAHPAVAGRDVRLLDAAVRIRLVGAGRTDLGGRVGDVVSLLPFEGRATGLTTSGLRYPLRDGRLESGPSRGLSNVRDEPAASVTVGTGRLLVVETPATL